MFAIVSDSLHPPAFTVQVGQDSNCLSSCPLKDIVRLYKGGNKPMLKVLKHILYVLCMRAGESQPEPPIEHLGKKTQP